MNDQQLAARMLGSVGDPNIQPRYVGDPNIVPRYPGGHVGAPLTKVDQYGNPIQYSEQEYLAGNVTWFGLGIVACPAGSIAVPDVDRGGREAAAPDDAAKLPHALDDSGPAHQPDLDRWHEHLRGPGWHAARVLQRGVDRAATRIPHDLHAHRACRSPS